MLVLAAGGSSPTLAGPSSVAAAANPAGFWTGDLRWTDCAGLRGCFALLHQVDPFVPNLRPALRCRDTYFRGDGPPLYTEYEAELWQVVSFRP